ncbi:MAG: SurA N-terminal domain-containing protein [Pseudomonadota bacterium]
MLDLMRKNARSWFIQVALFAVILVFVFWGIGSFSGNRGNRVATVNGTPITINEYRETYENLLKRYQDIYKNALSEKLITQLNLKEVALESLIERDLLVQEADRLNLRVTKNELKESIMDYPAFQQNSKFDHNRYINLLRYNRMTPEEFEASQKRDLIIKKVEKVIKDSAKISDKEALDIYTLENESINIEFIRLTSSSFIDKVKVSDEEIKDYYSKHNKDYQIPAKINVQYLSFNPNQYEARVEISEENINDYYQTNMEEFTLPEKVQARHILIKSLPDDNPESVKKARKKAEQVLSEIQRGVDFAKLARAYSDDPSANKGGDLGYIERNNLMEPIREAISSLKEGEVSPIIMSSFGYHILKVERVLNSRKMPLKEVRSQIISILRQVKARELADEKAENVNAMITEGTNLKKLASDIKMDIHETGFFAAGERIKELGINKPFSETAFSLKKGEISQLIKSSDINYILQVIDRMESRIPDLNEVKDSVKKDLQGEKANAMAKSKAEKLLENLRKSRKWEQLTSENNLKVEETGFFRRSDRIIPNIGYSEEIKENIFSLTPNEPFADRVFHINNTYFIAKFKNKKDSDEEKFNLVKDRLKKLLIEHKQEEIFKTWINSLKASAKITKNLSHIR